MIIFYCDKQKIFVEATFCVIPILCSGREPLGINGMGFCGPAVLPVTQPSGRSTMINMVYIIYNWVRTQMPEVTTRSFLSNSLIWIWENTVSQYKLCRSGTHLADVVNAPNVDALINVLVVPRGLFQLQGWVCSLNPMSAGKKLWSGYAGWRGLHPDSRSRMH